MATSLKQSVTERPNMASLTNGSKILDPRKEFPHIVTDREFAELLVKEKSAKLGGMLGKATSNVQSINNSTSYFQNYEGGCIIVVELDEKRVFEIHGAIYQKWNEMGRENYGLPLTDEKVTPDGEGRYNHFTNGKSIYWHPSTGAHTILGAIRQFWAENGWETSGFGYPVSDEISAPDSIGRMNYFQHEAIYWSPTAGAIEVNDVKTFEAMIVFSDGTALGGNTKVVVNKNGDCTFSGHLHDSGFDPYSFTVMGVIMTPSGIGYTLVYSGHTEGTSSDFFGSPNRDDDWTVAVNKPEIRNNWVQVNMAICEFRTTAQDKFASNVQDTLNDIAKDAVKALAAAGVKALIALI